MDIIPFVTSNADTILALLAALHAAAVAIVNLTPTPWDNQVYGKVYKGIEFAAGIFSYRAKGLPGEEDPLIIDDFLIDIDD
jgi:hypothetical protein